MHEGRVGAILDSFWTPYDTSSGCECVESLKRGVRVKSLKREDHDLPRRSTLLATFARNAMERSPNLAALYFCHQPWFALIENL